MATNRRKQQRRPTTTVKRTKASYTGTRRTKSIKARIPRRSTSLYGLKQFQSSCYRLLSRFTE